MAKLGMGMGIKVWVPVLILALFVGCGSTGRGKQDLSSWEQFRILRKAKEKGYLYVQEGNYKEAIIVLDNIVPRITNPEAVKDMSRYRDELIGQYEQAFTVSWLFDRNNKVQFHIVKKHIYFSSLDQLYTKANVFDYFSHSIGDRIGHRNEPRIYSFRKFTDNKPRKVDFTTPYEFFGFGEADPLTKKAAHVKIKNMFNGEISVIWEPNEIH
ncbi:hypothetical protein ACFL4W_01450 [Planctomycetota bacterium]